MGAGFVAGPALGLLGSRVFELDSRGVTKGGGEGGGVEKEPKIDGWRRERERKNYVPLFSRDNEPDFGRTAEILLHFPHLLH